MPEVRRSIALYYDEVWPALHRTGRLRASLTKPGATGAWADLRTGRDGAEVEIGTTLEYAPLLRTDPIPDEFPARDVEAWAELVADRIVRD